MLSLLSRYHDLQITTREDLQALCHELVSREIDTYDAFVQFLQDVSDMESLIQEDGAWRYIRHSLNTVDEEIKQHYEYHQQYIEPHLQSWDNELNHKIISNPLCDKLGEDYKPLLQRIRLFIKAFHPDNIPLHTQCDQLAQQYMQLCGALMIEYEGKTLTMQQSSVYLESADREVRRSIYDKQVAARCAIAPEIDEILTSLVSLRHKIAIQAGFDSFVDYSFAYLGRSDYTPADTADFADAVEQYITPIYTRVLTHRKESLGLQVLKPYDLGCDHLGRDPIAPFASCAEMVTAAKQLSKAIDPRFADLIDLLESCGHLDLESRQHKQPGGYNSSLLKSGLSFIFSNSACNSDGLNTLLHELGHAMHGYRMRNLPYYEMQQIPMEIAEVASMSMERFKNDYLDLVYSPQDAQRLREDKVLDSLYILCHVAVVDRLQYRLYTHPHHTIYERHAAYRQIHRRYLGDQVDWSGYEEMLDHLYHRQLHIREVPLYYIEYAIAEIGAIGIYMNLQKDKKSGLNRYFAMLDAGYTSSLPDLYRLGGIRLGFNAETIRDVADWLGKSL